MESLIQSVALDADPASSGGKDASRLRRCAPIAFVLGVGVLWPFIARPLAAPLLAATRPFSPERYALLGRFQVGSEIALLAVILLSARYWEGLAIRKIGLKWPSASDLGVGLALFTAVTIAMWLGALAGRFIFHATVLAHIRDSMGLLYRMPIGLVVAVAITNGITEEVYARGYAIERLEFVTHSTTLAVVIALALDLFLHLPYWGLAYTAMIAPGQVVLALAYLWRRDLAANFIAHTMNDMTPIIALALAPLLFAITGRASFYNAQGFMFLQKHDAGSAIVAYTRALARDPYDTSALIGRARAELHTPKGAEQAMRDLDSAILLKPTADAYWRRALARYEDRRYQPALDDLEQVLRTDPSYAPAYRFRAGVECDLGRYQEAVADLSRAIERDPSKAEYYEKRGYLYAATGDYKRAIEDLRHAGRLKPPDPAAHWYLAEAYDSTGDFSSAAEEYSRAAQMQPIWRSGSHLSRGQDFQRMGNYTAALEEYREAYRIAPDDPAALNGIAWALATMPDPKLRNGTEAVALAERALKLAGFKNAGIMDTLAAAYAEKGDYGAAVRTEKRAIAVAGKDDDVASDLRPHLALFERHQPYREQTPPVRAATMFPLAASATDLGTNAATSGEPHDR